MKKKEEASYNERLFSGGLRGRLHNARYIWVAENIKKYHCDYENVLEIGCFDGKVIDFLERKPKYYLGLDANWEGGLDIANKKWTRFSNYKFRKCVSPEQMQTKDDEFDITISMETLEHVPPELVSPYLKKISQTTKEYFFVTVPNEIGIVFFFKYIAKKLFGNAQSYTLSEIFFATLGMTEKVKRNEHKGFHYGKLINQISNYFDIIEVSGHPLKIAPPFLNFGIGVVARKKSLNNE